MTPRALLRTLVVLFAFSFGLFGAEPSRPLLSPVFGSHAVLQRDKPVLLWGWASPGETVTATLDSLQGATKASEAGRWELELPGLPAGGPHELAVRAESGQETRLTDLLMGDVWLCSGQSNMGWPLQMTDDAALAERELGDGQIRIFQQAQRSAYLPLELPAGEWKVMTADVGKSSSAVATYFALELKRHTGVPVGLVVAAMGGTPAESWISPAGLQGLEEFTAPLEQIAAFARRGVAPTGSFLMHWLEDHDQGGKNNAWAQPNFDDSSWASVDLPGNFAALNDAAHPVVAWFRRDFELPAGSPLAGKAMLGSIHKMDTTFINGRWIGASSWAENPRRYAIPAETLRPGVNHIAIRVVRSRANGGFLAKAEDFVIELADGSRLPLAGAWKAAVSVDAKPPFPPPLDWENYPTMPAVLQLGMVAPLAPLRASGLLWYQGEANSERSRRYPDLLRALCADWRGAFRQPDLPVYLAGLPRFMGRREGAEGDGWAQIRDAQVQTAARVPGMYVSHNIDLGNPDDIHPHDKRDVGRRLAWLALSRQFGRSILPPAPVPDRVERNGAALRIYFSNTGAELTPASAGLEGFIIAGADRKWHPARARLDGAAVLVEAPEVPEPVAARYAWQANPPSPLRTRHGLPVGPFRTDDWPLEKP